MDGTQVTALITTFSVAVTMVMQLGLKTLLEQLPFMRPQDGAVHDAVLRLVVFALNGALIVATALTTSAFAGLAWYDLLALSVGQTIISHGVFTVASSGGASVSVASVATLAPLAAPDAPVAAQPPAPQA